MTEVILQRPGGLLAPPKWPTNTLNELQNGVCKMNVDFGEKVPPEGGPRDPQGGPMGAYVVPRRASWPSRNCQNEARRASECTQNDIWKIDVSCEHPKIVKRRSRRPFLRFRSVKNH